MQEIKIMQKSHELKIRGFFISKQKLNGFFLAKIFLFLEANTSHDGRKSNIGK